MRVLFLIMSLSQATWAESVQCVAGVTNRTYTVTLDKDTLLMEVKTDNGYVHRGIANFHHSPRLVVDTYYLATGFDRALVLEFDLLKREPKALCLAQNECYICRP